MSTTLEPPTSGRDVIAQFLPQSPLVAKLGIVADQLRDDELRLRLPWDPSNTTRADAKAPDMPSVRELLRLLGTI